MRPLKILALIAVPLLLSAKTGAVCLSPSADQVVKLPGRPFAAEPSPDNCHLYVSLDENGSGAVAVLDNENGTFRIARTARIARRPARGLALAHRGTVLAVAAEDDLLLLDMARLRSPDADPVLARLPGVGRGSIYTQFSNDDALLFVSEERNGSIAVVDMPSAVQGRGEKAVIGRIPVGQAPVGLAVSPDGMRLFSTSEVVGSSDACKPEKAGGRRHANGALFAIDIARAAIDPHRAVAGVMPAGCNPVRVVVSSDGRSLWVSQRGDGRVMGLDPTVAFGGGGRAQTTLIAVGQSPVGLAIRPDGTELWVADSDRFASAAGSLALVTPANPAEAHLAGTLKVGNFPRDLRFLPDGRTLVVALFGESAVMLHPTAGGPRPPPSTVDR